MTHPAADDNALAELQAKADAASLARLRVIRLWHWRQLLRSRMHARSCASPSLMRQYNDEADMHLGFVQSLNDYFPDPHDTAERDASK